MTMQAQPVKNRFFNDEPETFTDNAHGLWIQCEVTHPPSRKGKKLFVHFDQEMVTKCLLVFRASAVEARR